MNLTSFSKNFWSRDYLSSKNVLVIPTTAIGDNLMLTAIVANLKEQYPHLNIYIKNNLTVQQIFKYHPAVTSLVNDSDKINYDAIIDYTNLIAKLPEYYNGLGFMDLMGNIAGIKFTEREIIFKISDVEIENARQEISNFSSKKIIGVHFSTSKDIKRSYQHGSELIRLINEQDKNTRFIHLGNEYVPGLDSSIVYDAALYSPELRKQIALSSFCDSFITIDSAFFHIGHNYFKKPTLGIFGLTNPELVGNHKAGFSYIRNESLNCLNCYWQIPCNIECMNNLKPEDIAKAFFNIKNNMIFGQDLKEEVINIEWDANPDDLLFNFFLSNRRALKPVINDFNNLLPEYSKNWNGIIINKSRNDRNTMNNTDIFPNNSGAFTIEGSKEINNNENQDNSQPLLLNLGCGDDIKKGFINIDLNGDDDRIVIMNVMNLDFPDNSVAVIYAADILPCFSYREIDDVLAEWNRVLIPGGKIIISCTSVKQICKLYMSGKINAEVMSRLIYGTQDNPLNFYLCGFDSDYLGSALKDAGFEIVRI